jgi:hypothetical protein
MNNQADTVSSTFCVLPWMHLHAWPEGKAFLCCIAKTEDEGIVGDFSKNTYAQIINSDLLKKIRTDMLAGKKISNCENCYDREALSGASFRKSNNENYKDLIPSLLDSTLEDGTLVDPKMFYMDYRFSNLCNLGCRTCGGTLSSTIAAEKHDFNKEQIIELRSKNVLNEKGNVISFSHARPDFLEVDVYPYLKDVRQIYFAGGEALMHDEHYAILNHVINNKLTDQIQLTYSTNLTSLKYKGHNFIPLWEQFKNLYFLASIDGQKEQLEYIRKGTSNKNVFANLKTLLDFKETHSQKSISVNICYTHSIYNCYYSAEFFEYLDTEGILDRLDDVLWNNAFSDRNRPYILPDFAKQELKEKRKQDLNNPSMQKAMKKFKNLKHEYKVIDDWLDTPTDFGFDNFLKEFNDKYNTFDSLKTALPWLASVIERYKQL